MHYQAQFLTRKRSLEVDLTTEQSRNKRKETTNNAFASCDVPSNNVAFISRPQVDPNPSQTANNRNGEKQTPITDEDSWPNFDPWEDLGIFEGLDLDLWQEDFGFIEDPQFSFNPEEEAEVTGDNAGFETASASHADSRVHSSHERVAIQVHSLFNTPLTQTVC